MNMHLNEAVAPRRAARHGRPRDRLSSAARSARAIAQAAGSRPASSRRTPSSASAPTTLVTVLSKHIEFGQGPLYRSCRPSSPRSSTPTGRRCARNHAPADAKLYNNTAFGPIQGTGGSTAIANSYDQLRKAGATARAMLVAGRERGLEGAGGRDHGRARRVAPCGVRAGRPLRAIRRSRGKTAGAGQCAAEGSVDLQADRPRRRGAQARHAVKDQRHRAVHHRHPRAGHADGGGRASGSLRRQGRARSTTRDARKVEGVVDVKTLPSGVAVYANGTWPALKARDLLKITWDDSRAPRSAAPRN